jgi:hypothetical protein
MEFKPTLSDRRHWRRAQLARTHRPRNRDRATTIRPSSAPLAVHIRRISSTSANDSPLRTRISGTATSRVGKAVVADSTEQACTHTERQLGDAVLSRAGPNWEARQITVLTETRAKELASYWSASGDDGGSDRHTKHQRQTHMEETEGIEHDIVRGR